MSWNSLKNKGSSKYKTASVEPIDLYRAGGFFNQFALGSIIKYAYRNAKGKVNPKDLKKIIHYAELLLSLSEEKGRKSSVTTGTSNLENP
ncbi:MAG: DUF3310 domain-containing protein [bacterium]|nr:DUF3310 domain-containing protein [bacterium]